MTVTRKLIIAFWIFIVAVLAWQFYSYNQGMTKEATEHPKPEHFFFFHSNANASVEAPPKPEHGKANVKQAAFTVKQDVPTRGSFTCSITLKNTGDVKAVNIEVHVRPYKGITLGDEDVGHSSTAPLSDNDPLSQIGQWVTFPDIPPGESRTTTAIFLSREGVHPGANPSPEISFQSEKAKP
jgi:hypothetical protein